MITSLTWIITAKCNLDCKHCYVKPRLLGKPELTLQQKARIAEEAAQLGIRHAAITGGEPLIHPHFLAIAQILREHGVNIYVSTNATAITPQIARLLAKLEAHATASLDGPDKQTHEQLRGPGTWSKAIEGIKLLKAEGVPVTPVMAVHRHNYYKTGQYLELAHQLGLPRAALIPVIPTGRAREARLAPTPSQFAQAVKRAAEKARELAVHVTFWCAPFTPIIARNKYTTTWSCRQTNAADLDPAGKILLCDTLDIELADASAGLQKALQQYQNHPLVKAVRNPRPLPQPCKECPIADTCKAGCFARAYLQTGKLTAPDPLCPRTQQTSSSLAADRP